MNPTVCTYCGMNFMKKFEEDRVCNNCALRFISSNREKHQDTSLQCKKSTVRAQIEMPDYLYKQIEEYCINQGISLSTYFLGLSHHFRGKEMGNTYLIGSEKDIPPLLPIVKKSIPEDKEIIPRSLKTKRKREKNVDN